MWFAVAIAKNSLSKMVDVGCTGHSPASTKGISILFIWVMSEAAFDIPILRKAFKILPLVEEY